MKIGIDAIQMYIPSILLPIEELAKARNIEPAKLKKGLGLEAMRLMDIDEDVVSMGTTAVYRLLEEQQLQLKDIDRLYVGTESSIDNSKPVASYILQNIIQLNGENTSVKCDVVDFTFACIGAVDALQNCIDYIRLNPSKKAIVVATDFAKYELASTGEYTQGAGAFAMLLSSDPQLLAINPNLGTSTKGVFDFFKPKFYKETHTVTYKEVYPVINDEPVFDGQYSNECYINQISEAYQDFKNENEAFQNANEWDLICMHLPYCFQGRRTFVELFAKENPSLLAESLGESTKEKMKSLSKSEGYLDFTQKRIAPSEYLSAKVGNCYTGSIFLGFISSLLKLTETGENASKVGFIAYGSGSKSKVFEGKLVDGWQAHFNAKAIAKAFEGLTEIDFATYEKLHQHQITKPLVKAKEAFSISHIEEENPVLFGARYYKN
jgi:hydroxymethylglutaryl-CoA synthase